jgi:hypothetical protein
MLACCCIATAICFGEAVPTHPEGTKTFEVLTSVHVDALFGAEVDLQVLDQTADLKSIGTNLTLDWYQQLGVATTSVTLHWHRPHNDMGSYERQPWSIWHLFGIPNSVQRMRTDRSHLSVCVLIKCTSNCNDVAEKLSTLKSEPAASLAHAQCIIGAVNALAAKSGFPQPVVLSSASDIVASISTPATVSITLPPLAPVSAPSGSVIPIPTRPHLIDRSA